MSTRRRSSSFGGQDPPNPLDLGADLRGRDRGLAGRHLGLDLLEGGFLLLSNGNEALGVDTEGAQPLSGAPPSAIVSAIGRPLRVATRSVRARHGVVDQERQDNLPADATILVGSAVETIDVAHQGNRMSISVVGAQRAREIAQEDEVLATQHGRDAGLHAIRRRERRVPGDVDRQRGALVLGLHIEEPFAEVRAHRGRNVAGGRERRGCGGAVNPLQRTHQPVNHPSSERRVVVALGGAIDGVEGTRDDDPERASREEMRKPDGQPRTLLTNVKQLELLLTRQKDVELFDGARLDFLVFEEAHTFSSATGADTTGQLTGEPGHRRHAGAVRLAGLACRGDWHVRAGTELVRLAGGASLLAAFRRPVSPCISGGQINWFRRVDSNHD